MTGSAGPTRRTGLRTLVAGLAAVPLLGTAAASQPRHEGLAPRRTPPRAAPLRVMTFNLRVPAVSDPWPVRRPVMRTLLRRAAPHVIGTQEGQFTQLRNVWGDLGAHYDWIGTPGSGNEESTAVYYDVRRLEPVEHDVFRLSDTPTVPGSETWGGAFPRLVTRVRFRDRLDGGREFHVLNTHLDHRSAYARARAAALIAERVRGLGPGLPVLLTGDFNAAAHASPAYDTLLACGLVDTWDTAARRGPAYGTFHGYQPLRPDGDRIDWILATPGVTVHRSWVDTFAAAGQYPSDHLPVLASLTLP
ncbi:endonuclease/exonuclease/phosphatase family protein [Streptomyces antibioticus]|uniref:Endonuclease n=1 Tax=Streptomyces antibioticus TaxID=1890 RepID=A0AAE6Y4T4_STRAT|nr:endonuclease/exonuclease/phosphatase family protein [Streptomyces antibioticus]MCX4743675.1 endonuclease/exonuclease/phosphatase family protein [Streptomyces antibioticus]OOQ55204.1 endonuclease [Streptomyces antibioticus]QIT42841.1 endonuclease/exonuclease/phosphatase family protein [Streptomyces antibioticus]